VTPLPQPHPAIRLEQDGPVVTVTLCDPDHLNAQVPSMWLALADIAHGLADDVRVVVLAAEGKAFSAGAEFKQGGGEDASRNTADFYGHALRLFRTAKPIVAAVQGAAVGAGLGLALVADFRVTCNEARFSANFNRLGFHPGFGLSLTLPRLVGEQQAALKNPVEGDQGRAAAQPHRQGRKFAFLHRIDRDVLGGRTPEQGGGAGRAHEGAERDVSPIVDEGILHHVLAPVGGHRANGEIEVVAGRDLATHLGRLGLYRNLRSTDDAATFKNINDIFDLLRRRFCWFLLEDIEHESKPRTADEA